MKERGMYFPVTDCTSAELAELKEAYYWMLVDFGETDVLPKDINPFTTNLIPNDIIFREYEGYAFVDEDFFCNI